MESLLNEIKKAESSKRALAHFNVSDSVAFKAIIESAKQENVPIIIGVSEGEREFFGMGELVSLVRNAREHYGIPVYLNADHTRSLEKVKEALDEGFDSIIFDGSKLSLEDNISETKKAVEMIKSERPEVVAEGELGYIGSSSEFLESLPEGAAVRAEEMTSPEDAARFVKETGVDLFSPAVGNIHGMLKNSPNPRLNISLIKQIKEAVVVPLVLHGGSGICDEDFISAIDVGISVIHINTELRSAWRRGMEEGLSANPNSVTPYKIYLPAISYMREVLDRKIRLFSKK